MKFYTSEIVKKAIKARQEGKSLRKIEKELNISSSTLSKWVRNISSNNPIYKKARLTEKQNKNLFNQLVTDYPLNKDQAKILLSLLYWCEGSKYPASNCIAFSNSDWTLVKTFIELFRKAFKIDEKKLRGYLQIHSNHDYQNILNYWSRLLNIPKVNFYKPIITNPTKRMKRTSYIGTCTIKYYDVKLLLNIIGIYESFAKRFIKGEVA